MRRGRSRRGGGRACAQDLAAKGAGRGSASAPDRLTPADREAFEALAADATLKSGDMPNVAALVEAVRNAFTLPFA